MGSFDPPAYLTCPRCGDDMLEGEKVCEKCAERAQKESGDG